jgi:hypothetical protein
MTRVKAALAAFIGLFLLGLPHARAESLQAQYRLYYNGLPLGEVTERWERDGDSYHLSSVAKPYPVLQWVAPTFNESSVGKILPAGLEPIHFEHRRSDDSRPMIADFHWDEGVLVQQHEGKTESEDLKPGTQDALSIKYLFRIAGNKALNIDIPVTTGKRVEVHHLVLLDERAVDTEAGLFQTRHIVDRGQSAESSFDLWLANDERYPPVRMIVTERGNHWEQRLLKVTFQ